MSAVVATTAQQIADHGWKTFVFRAPGVGSTHAHAEPTARATK